MEQCNEAKYPYLALPYTILSKPNQVRLVAGEDFRYTFEGKSIESWFPPFLAQIDGSQSLDSLWGQVPESYRSAAKSLTIRLYQERILTDAPAILSHSAFAYTLKAEGSASLISSFSDQDTSSSPQKILRILCQDNLDYQGCLTFNTSCLQQKIPSLWFSTGAMSRAYISPIFLPYSGPCLECLLRQFQQLSPLPKFYEQIMQQKPDEIRVTPFPSLALAMLKNFVLWKISLANEEKPSPTLYQLHVLEVSRLEIQAHRLRKDPECPSCLRYKV